MAFPWLLTILARLTHDRLRSGGRRLRLERLEERLVLATYTVTNTNSSGIGSLAFEISQANLLTSGTADIAFDPAVFSSASTITLAGTLTLSDTSVTLTTITGTSAGVTISGNDSFGVFQVNGSVTATLSGLTITHGKAGDGGGIYNAGTLTVSGSTLSGNSANSRGGGGIYNAGTLTVSGSTLSDNSATGGGGIANYGNGTCTVSSSTLTGNGAISGGGILNTGTLTVSGSTLSDNSAQFGGGGISNGGTLTMTGCTLSGNYAEGPGGGIGNSGTLTVIGSTLSGNSAKMFSAEDPYRVGGGIHNTGTLNLRSSIVAGNSAYSAGPDISGTLISLGFNLVGNTSGSSGYVSSDQLNLNPRLAPLADNGGPTQTMALLFGSPALDAGDNTLATPGATDQRGVGFSRQVGKQIDIGAFESSGLTNPPPPPFNFQKLGAYRPSNGSWSLDSDGTTGFGTNDQVFLQFNYKFGSKELIGVVGDWTGSGRDNIGEFDPSNGTWFLDLNGNGKVDFSYDDNDGRVASSETFSFGTKGDQPVVGNWDGNKSGRSELGVFRAVPGNAAGAGEFILDINNSRTLNAAAKTFIFGLATDHVIVGDWNGTGKTKVGVYRDARDFRADAAGDIVFSLNSSDTDPSVFTNFVFGLITDKVVIGDWNGDGKAKVAVYRDGASVTDVANPLHAPGTALFSEDFNGDLNFTGVDKVFLFGLSSDQFVAGNWVVTPPLQPNGL